MDGGHMHEIKTKVEGYATIMKDGVEVRKIKFTGESDLPADELKSKLEGMNYVVNSDNSREECEH